MAKKKKAPNRHGLMGTEVPAVGELPCRLYSSTFVLPCQPQNERHVE